MVIELLQNCSFKPSVSMVLKLKSRSRQYVVSLSETLYLHLLLSTHLNNEYQNGDCSRTVLVDPNGSCLFAAGLPTDTVGSENFQTFSTRQTPHLGD